MNILLAIFVFTATFHLISSAPADHIHEYELAMLNKLHKPWFTAEKLSEYPRKGEYPCKGGICRNKATEVQENCEDCQHAIPLTFDYTDYTFSN